MGLPQVFVELCRQPVSAYLERFGFRSDLLKAMYAVTDGVSGLTATWDMPGSGLNFLCHNMVQPWVLGFRIWVLDAWLPQGRLERLFGGPDCCSPNTSSTRMGAPRALA